MSSSSSSMQFSISTPKMAATSYCSSSLNHLLTSLPNFHRHPPSLSFLSPNSRPCPFLRKGCSSILTASLTGRSCGVARASLKMEEEPMVPPYNVLITGSTKGIGYALAKEFLKAGDNVLICSRSAERVEATVEKLREEFGKDHVVQDVMLKKDKM